MKKLFVYGVGMALCSPVLFAGGKTWTGRISDAMCTSDHSMMQKGAAKVNENECTAACVKSGQKYVLVTDGKVYQVVNQAGAGLAANAGRAVKVTGEASADGKSITISRIDPAIGQ